MWEVYEHRQAAKRLDRLPVEVLKRYEKWKDIVRVSGPTGVRLIKGFHDEALRGEWKGHRSSRLSQQYRVIYKVEAERVEVIVMEITAHDYSEEVLSRKEIQKSRKRVDVSVGESVRIIRELQDLSQNELSQRTGIPQSTISAIENDRVKLGVERAKVLGRALKCHPAVLVFPGWDVAEESAA